MPSWKYALKWTLYTTDVNPQLPEGKGSLLKYHCKKKHKPQEYNEWTIKQDNWNILDDRLMSFQNNANAETFYKICNYSRGREGPAGAPTCLH